MEARRSYDKNGVLEGITVVLKPSEANDLVYGHEVQDEIILGIHTVVRKELERVKEEG
jgi:hypothetical protein